MDYTVLTDVGIIVVGSLEEMKDVQQQYLDGEWFMPWEDGISLKRTG